jgi:hypothetical protein
MRADFFLSSTVFGFMGGARTKLEWCLAAGRQRLRTGRGAGRIEETGKRSFFQDTFTGGNGVATRPFA